MEYLLSVFVFLQSGPTFNAPAMTDILTAATQLFNPFVGIAALAIGVILGGKLLQRVIRMFR